MPLLQIDEPDRKAARRLTPFALAFRPFFLLAGLAAAVLIPIWAIAFASGRLGPNYYGFIEWHGHEMVFGYAVAVAVGFLLTAARNWTGIETVKGTPLAALAALWLLGRVVPFFPGPLPGWLIAAADLAFLPAVALALGGPLWRARHYKSFAFVLVFALLTGANAVIHLERLGLIAGGARQALYFAVDLIVLLIVIMGGRVIPFFTEKALPGVRMRRWPVVEAAAVSGLVLLAALEALYPQSDAVAVAALLAAVANGVRLVGWWSGRVWGVPLLWVLHAGYGWLVAGLALRAAAGVGWVAPSLALHALTAGAIGLTTLGMMARVALGHTGRPLRLPRGMATGFVLLALAGLVRVLLPMLFPAQYVAWIGLSGALWALAFFTFLVLYVPILMRARIDGRPG
jgi:uncharacterized protein involved in response to NO